MVAYAAAFMSCTEAGYDASQVFANVNINKDLLLKIVSGFQEAIEHDKKLYAIQQNALEKLEEILPDPSAPAE